MTPERRHQQPGLTLTDLVAAFMLLLVGALVIASLLFVPKNNAVPRSASMSCLSQARAIACTIRAYASNWDGWTNPDPCHYMKEYGYRLNSETGYYGEAPPWYVPGSVTPTQSHQYAASIRDFRCPLDERPILRAHGIPTSHQVSAFFAGYNLMALRREPHRVLAVVEVGKRHHLKGEPPGGSQVYADMSARMIGR